MPVEQTCWTLVRGAAGGDADARANFAQGYLPIVRAYLGARWQGGPFRAQIDDAVQDVFLECFREGGALERADPARPGRFRTFLYAVVRNVARRHEERGARTPAPTELPPDAEAPEARLSRAFDRAWADALLRGAVRRMRRAAEDKGPRARRRIEILSLRFVEDLPIREIAGRWREDAAYLHHEYAKGRAEFKAALRDEVAFHCPGARDRLERECMALLELVD